MPVAMQRLLLLTLAVGAQACMLGEGSEAEAEPVDLTAPGPDLHPDFGLGSAPDGSGPSGGHAAPGAGRAAPLLQPTTFEHAAGLVGQASELVQGAAHGEPRRLTTGAPPTSVHLPIGGSSVHGGHCSAPGIDPDAIPVELDPDASLEQRTFGTTPVRTRIVDGCR